MNKPVKRVRFRAPRLALSYGKSLSYVKLLQQLKEIQANPNPRRGICDQISKKNRYVMYLDLSALFSGWPHHSGNIDFPVPGTKSKSAESRYKSSVNKWKGDYGELRKDLLAYMINKVETKIQEAKVKQGF